MEKPISLEQYVVVENYINSLSYNTKITISKAAQQLRLDDSLTGNLLAALVDIGVLQYGFVIRCPECSLLLKTAEDIANIEHETYCYGCDEIIQIEPSDIEVIYTLFNCPFQQGQQNDKKPALVTSAVHKIDSLAHLISLGKVNINTEFFAPTDSEWEELYEGYSNIFTSKSTTTKTGYTLEKLTMDLFDKCKHFCVTGGLRISSDGNYTSQIDCYVRNTLYNPVVSLIGDVDSFVIECKNETRTPRGEYMKKLRSDMLDTGKHFGIIISKCKAPRTFVSLSNKIFLNSKITIIWMDSEDLMNIIIHKQNLLEMLARKIEEVRLTATKDLRALGLYDC